MILPEKAARVDWIFLLNRRAKTACIRNCFETPHDESASMNLIQIADALEATLAHAPQGWEQINIETVFASDLMSDVLMSDRDDMLLITSLSTEQSIRSAGIVGSEAVIIANNKTVTEGMVELAREQDIALFCTRFPKYESCVRLGRLMES
jgi:hypothetical protein